MSHDFEFATNFLGIGQNFGSNIAPVSTELSAETNFSADKKTISVPVPPFGTVTVVYTSNKHVWKYEDDNVKVKTKLVISPSGNTHYSVKIKGKGR